MSAPYGLFGDYSSLVPIQPVSGVINKDCTEAECLYSSQCRYLSRDTGLQCRAVKVLELVSSPHVTNPTQHYSL